MSAFCFLFCLLEQYECHQAMKSCYALWSITIKHGFHVTYLFSALWATAQFFESKKGSCQWENLENKRKEKEQKESNKQKQTLVLLLYYTFQKIRFLCYFIALSKKNFFFYCNNILWWNILKKNILLVYHSASFCFQGLLITSKLHLRELEKNKHWILSLSYIFLSLFLPSKRRLKRSEWFLWELNQKRSEILNLIRNIL